MRCLPSSIAIFFCNKPIWLAHHSTKWNYGRSPKQKVLFWHIECLTYIAERRTTFAKACGFKNEVLWRTCWRTHWELGEHTGNPSRTQREPIGNFKGTHCQPGKNEKKNPPPPPPRPCSIMTVLVTFFKWSINKYSFWNELLCKCTCNPITFCPSPPLLTYIGGPKGEALHLSIESSIVGRASIDFFLKIFLWWVNQNNSLQNK
jgi:hypothetical protein